MAQNAADGGARRFILVQLDEKIDSKKNKSAYDFCRQALKSPEPSIFDITKERLIRAKEKLIGAGASLDLDFKIYEVSAKEQGAQDLKTFNKQQELNFLAYDTNAVLNTWKAYDGIKLHENLAAIRLENYTAFYGADKLYLIEPHFTHEDLLRLVEKLDDDKNFKPKTIVLYSENFDSAMQNEICHNLDVLKNKKSIEVKTLIRHL